MLSRISILSFVTTLAVLLCWEYRIDSVDIENCNNLQEHLAASLTDTDINNITSQISSQPSSLCSPSNSRRSIQRSNSKCFENTQIVTQSKTKGISLIELSNYVITSNRLGGVVAKRAFYSLCCLRIWSIYNLYINNIYYSLFNKGWYMVAYNL